MQKPEAKVLQENALAHGGLDFAELEQLKLNPDQIVDFSVNSNPYGPSPRVREVLLRTDLITNYPDRQALQLSRAIVEFDLGLELDGKYPPRLSLNNLATGNGAAELIWTIARAFLGPGHTAGMATPTFGEYRRASLAAGAEVVEYRTASNERTGFWLDYEELARWIGLVRPSLFWLCNPNNPTGTWLDEIGLHRVAQACWESGTLLVVDEAYHRFLWPKESFSALNLIQQQHHQQSEGLIVVRSLTKDYALARLRLGYTLASPDLTRRIKSQLPPWNVNGLAQAAGCVALGDQAYLERTLSLISQQRLLFFEALSQTDFEVLPSRTHFCLIKVGEAREVRRKLLEHKILVRDCASFGLSNFIRVSTRPQEEWPRLVELLHQLNQPIGA